MRSLYHFSDNPFINLATEEYLLKQASGDFFFLYRNRPSVIVGKHQNTLAEINYPFVVAQQMDVARRISGGGTVFHDHGNLNFTFIIRSEQKASIDFAKHLSPVIRVLGSYGIATELTKSHSLLANGRKISGNAEHLYKNTVMHHGTLLYDTDIEMLEHSIRNDRVRYTDRAIRSVRSGVGNLRPMLADQPVVEEFAERFFNNMKAQLACSSDFTIHKEQLSEIELLAEQKYMQWDWIFGFSPEYTFRSLVQHVDGPVDISLNVSKGVITGCEATRTDGSHVPEIENLLPGAKHQHTALWEKLNPAGMPDSPLKINFTSLLEQLF